MPVDSLRSNNYSAAISPSKNTGCFSARIVPVGDITERRKSILGGTDQPNNETEEEATP